MQHGSLIAVACCFAIAAAGSVMIPARADGPRDFVCRDSGMGLVTTRIGNVWAVRRPDATLHPRLWQVYVDPDQPSRTVTAGRGERCGMERAR